jgi:hemerythrin-like domain-containing protein
MRTNARERDAFEILGEDHQRTMHRLERLEPLLAEAEMRSEEDIKNGLMEFESFLDTEVWAHFRKEEEHLFPLLDAHFPFENAPVAGGPMRVLREEHQIIRKLAERLHMSMENSADKGGWLVAAKLSGRQLVTAIRKHIYKEDFVVFRLATSLLTEEERYKLNSFFASPH